VIVCVASSPSVDKLFEVDRVEVGAIHRPLAFTQVPGGKGLNVARAAHLLGAEVRATGILAGHTGRWLEEALAAEGVPGVFAWSEGETRASLSVADRTDRGLTEFYERGTDIGPGGWERLEGVVIELMPGAAWVTLSGNLPVGAPDDGYARLIERARSAGARVALDARDEALARGVAARPDVVKVNAEEAAGLLGCDVATMEDAGAAAREICSHLEPDGAAIVTRGADGAMIATPEGSVLLGRLYARGPYPVGSGDAFLAGLVVCLERGGDWAAATCLALGAAAANAERAGAGRLDALRAEQLAAGAEVLEARASGLAT
jgi:1-phosphofructokinase family hexose kinase